MFNTEEYHPFLDKYPKHIAIVPDGGRRWAKEHGCTNYEAYLKSVELISQIIVRVFEKGTEVVTLFFASTANFKRSTQEVQDFCSASWDYINGALLQLAQTKNFRIRIIRTDNQNFVRFAEDAKRIETLTNEGNKTCNICFNYSSLDEIQNATELAAQKGGLFLSYLQIPIPVDILIRTGGANVLSNFLLPQLSAARLYFVDKLFNDLSLEDVDIIINQYTNTVLKYGE